MRNETILSALKTGMATLVLTGSLYAGKVQAQSYSQFPDSSSVAVSAQLSVGMEEMSSLRFRLALSKPVVYSYELVMVSLLDKDTNRPLFRHTFYYYELKEFAFDLSQLSDGNYALEILMGADAVTKPFEIQTQVSRVAFARNDVR